MWDLSCDKYPAFYGIEKNGIYRHLVGCDGIYHGIYHHFPFFGGCSWDIRTGYMPFSDETANAVEVLSHFVGS